MRSGSYERGDQPRSVCDPDRDAYEAMIHRHKTLMGQGQVRPAAKPPQPRTEIDHGAATIVHLLNGPRAARHELEGGKVAEAALHGATAAADLAWAGLGAKGLLKGHFKLRGPHKWRTAPFEPGQGARQWMGAKGIVAKGQDAHHALIPNQGWGKYVPDFIKNQPFNIRPMEEKLTHIRIHGNSRKFSLPKFNAVERYVHGTPRWWKAANATIAGHTADISAHHLARGQHAGTHPSSRPSPPRK